MNDIVTATSTGRRPRLSAPAGAADCHMHIYGPATRFQAAGPTQPPDFPLESYLALRERLGISRTVYVQPSGYGGDHACMLDAMARDPAPARGIAILDAEVPDAELAHLDAAGVRGVRFIETGRPSAELRSLEAVAARIAPLGWHVQVQFEGDAMEEVAPRLLLLPCPVVIDHIGRIPVEGGTDRAAFRALLRLMENGRAWVKLSAPYHTSKAGPPHWRDLAGRAGTLAEWFPDRLVWATNTPHPSVPVNKPDDADLLDMLGCWLDETAIRLVLVDNPIALYGFPPAGT